MPSARRRARDPSRMDGASSAHCIPRRRGNCLANPTVENSPKHDPAATRLSAAAGNGCRMVNSRVYYSNYFGHDVDLLDQVHEQLRSDPGVCIQNMPRLSLFSTC
eukprot:6180382-Pleurochrysis_carterae.AAC.1